MARDHRHHHHHHHPSGLPSSRKTSNSNSTSHSNDRDHGTGSSVKSKSSSSGSSHTSSRRQYRVPNPPVPHAQASLLQVVPGSTTRVSASAPAPVSSNRRNGNENLRQHLDGTTSNNMNTNIVQEVPAGDPEAMDAKKGLNEWGAFGGGDSGIPGGTAPFGFGPLLFHHQGSGAGDSGSSEDGDKTASNLSTVSRDPFEIDQLLMGDPISFNPLQAISWAKLDEDMLDEDGDEIGMSGGVTIQRQAMYTGLKGGEQYMDSSPEQAFSDTSGLQPTNSHRDYSTRKTVSASPTSASSSTVLNSTETAVQAQRGANSRNSPYGGGGYAVAEHSPIIGNASQTLSAVSLSTPEPPTTTMAKTDIYCSNSNNSTSSIVIVPGVPPTGRGVSEQTKTSSHGTSSGSSRSSRRQQRHRQPRETKKGGAGTKSHHSVVVVNDNNSHSSSGSIPTSQQHPYPTNDPYPDYAFPPPPPPPPLPPVGSFAVTSFEQAPPFHQPSAHRFQTSELQYQQPSPLPPNAAASSYGTYAPIADHPYSHPHPHAPRQRQQQQQQQLLFLCLAPSCSARFRCEPELNAHYRAEHSFTCNWASCKSASFTSNNALVWHVKAEHLLLCPVPGCCDRVFANKKALDGHVRV